MRGWKRRRISLNILIVKLSSLGDVVHTMPAVQDIRRALPHAHIDWVVEPGFAALVARCEGVRRVIPCAMRLWRKHWMRASTRAAWQAFNTELSQVKYDAVIDCQGLTKSAIVARCAQLTKTGKRYALANRTDGSSYEAPTRWLTDVAVAIPPRTPAVQRTRLLCAQALGYAITHNAARFGLLAQSNIAQAAIKTIAFIHGTSRADKCWSELHWVQLGKKLCAQGYHIALLHGSDEEEQRSHRIAQALGAGAQVWPRLPLDALTDQLALCAGAIGVDSGLAHIAVALDLLHVQIYNFDTAWRTGPIDLARQCSVYASPQPSVAQVWDAWQRVQTQAPVNLRKA
jgi:heptosyltransferase I